MSLKEFSNQIVSSILYEELKRSVMPQVTKEYLDKLKKILEQNGVLFTEEKVSVADLKPVQDKAEKKRVKELKEKLKNGDTFNSLIVSEDYYILDGHHRWKALSEIIEETGSTFKVPVFRIHNPRNQALVMLSDAVKRMEEQTDDLDTVVVYAGRFQPFHRGHYSKYKHLVDRFGTNNVYIATSNKVDPKKSPFNFNEKKSIITKLFDVPDRMVVQVKNPYAANEVLEKYDKDKTVYVAAVGEKDESRLKGGKYFSKYNPRELKPLKDQGYYYVLPTETFKIDGKPISGTEVRNAFGSSGLDEDEKKQLFKNLFGRFDQRIYDLVSKRLSERIIPDAKLAELIKAIDFNEVILRAANDVGISLDESVVQKVKDRRQKVFRIGAKFVATSLDKNCLDRESVIKEAAIPVGKYLVNNADRLDGKTIRRTIGEYLVRLMTERTNSYMAHADDGPPSWYSTPANYVEKYNPVAEQLGWEVVDTLMTSEITDDPYTMKDDSLLYVSFYPVGVADEAMVSDPDRSYKSFINAVVSHAGWEVVSYLGAELARQKSPDYTTGEDELQLVEDWVTHRRKLLSEELRVVTSTEYFTQVQDLHDTIADNAENRTLFELCKEEFIDVLRIGMSNGFIDDDTYQDVIKLFKYIDWETDLAHDVQTVMDCCDLILGNEDRVVVIHETKERINELTLEQYRDAIAGLKRLYAKANDRREMDRLKNLYQSGVRKGISGGFVDDKTRRKLNRMQKGTITLSSTIDEEKEKILNLLDFIEKNLTENVRKKKSILNEGGGFGHLAHPFDDMDLTFGDLKDMITLAYSGKLDVEETPVEKTDGQNLMISWKNNRLVAARNKGHLKNFGKTALDLKGIIAKFDGRGTIKDAFEFAMRDLEYALSKLSSRDLEEIFAEGRKFMSLEVIYVPTQNVIPYDRNLLVFQGLVEHDEAGKVVGYDRRNAVKLANMVKETNQDVQKNFKIMAQPAMKMPAIKDTSSDRGKVLGALTKLQSKYNLKDSDEIVKYHESWWRNFIEEKSKAARYDIPDHVVTGLIKRWAYGNKSGVDGYSVSDMTSGIEHDEFLEWAREFDKKDYSAQMKENIKPFELIFLKVGADVLRHAEIALAADPERSRQAMVADFEKARREIIKSRDEGAINKLNYEMERLQSIGGIDSIVPTEGLVFQYKGSLYKLTGTFAPVNQILGIFRFGR